MQPPSHPRQQLAQALRERLAVIRDHAFRDRDPESHLQRLKTVSEQIAHLQSQLPTGTDSQFLHYLQRSSYDKALAWLEAQPPGPAE